MKKVDLFHLSSEERITKMKIQLQRDHPFFSYLLLHLEVIPSPHVKIAATDSFRMFFNPETVNEMDDDTLLFVMLHETLHCAFEHMKRIGKRDKFLWNIATDFCINGILVSSNIGKMPKNALYEPELVGKSAEEIYDLLKQHIIEIPVVFELVDEHFYPEDEDEKRLAEEIRKVLQEEGHIQWRRILIRAAHYAKQHGKLPAGMMETIDELNRPRMSWRALLYRYVVDLIPSDYTWLRPNKKYLAYNIYLPGIVKADAIMVLIAIDTSGSINTDTLKIFLGECYGIQKSFESVQMHVIQCDAAVQDYFVLENDFPSKISVKGRGGTDFRPVFQFIEDELIKKKGIAPQVLIYFTDGYGTFPDSPPPSYDVIWVLTSDVQVPFGTVIRYSDDDPSIY